MSILFCGIVGCLGAVAVRGVSRFFSLSIQHPISYSILCLCIIGSMFYSLYSQMWVNMVIGIVLFAVLVILFKSVCKAYSKYNLITHACVVALITSATYFL